MKEGAHKSLKILISRKKKGGYYIFRYTFPIRKVLSSKMGEALFTKKGGTMHTFGSNGGGGTGQ